jgi:hypothetical protein
MIMRQQGKGAILYLIGGGCGGARGEEEKKQGQETMNQTGGVLLRREVMVEMRLSWKIYQRHTQCLCFPFGRT